jgi:hypothetical protein
VTGIRLEKVQDLQVRPIERDSISSHSDRILRPNCVSCSNKILLVRLFSERL